jgi:hypothetical protein
VVDRAAVRVPKLVGDLLVVSCRRSPVGLHGSGAQ